MHMHMRHAHAHAHATCIDPCIHRACRAYAVPILCLYCPYTVPILWQARELHASGALRFVGEYAGGVRHGEGIELREDGGCLAGTWVEGELHGTR